MSEIQMGLKIQSAQGEKSFSFFYNQGLIELNESRQKVINEINDSLVSLLNKEIYYYLASLSDLVDVLTVQIMNLAVFNRKIIDEEKEGREKLIEQCEFALDKISEIDLRKMLFRSLANYYYWIQESEKAVEYMSKAIDLGKEDRDKTFAEGSSKLLEQMKKRPNPYETPEAKSIDEMTVEEYQEMTRGFLNAQGITLDQEDDLTDDLDDLTDDLIAMALRDMNPKRYFQHCENLHIGYVNTSPVGASIGLPTMGTKIVWCKHSGGSIAGFDLKGAFDIFRQQHCRSCKFHKPRSKDWVCYVKWVKDQQNDPDFKKVLDNFKRNW